MEFWRKTPEVKNMNNKYYNLQYTIIKNRNEKEIIEDKIDYDNICVFDNIIMAICFIGKDHDAILR